MEEMEENLGKTTPVSSSGPSRTTSEDMNPQPEFQKNKRDTGIKQRRELRNTRYFEKFLNCKKSREQL